MSYTFYGAPSMGGNDGYATVEDAEKSLKRVLNLIVPVYDTKEELIANLQPGFDPKQVGIATITVTVTRLSDE